MSQSFKPGVEPFVELVGDGFLDIALREYVPQLLFVVGQLEEIMFGLFQNGRRAAVGAAGIYQVGGLIRRAANLAGIAILVLGFAFRAGAADEPVGQSHFAVGAPCLVDVSFCN